VLVALREFQFQVSNLYFRSQRRRLLLSFAQVIAPR
jgi:hypothetical protein